MKKIGFVVALVVLLAPSSFGTSLTFDITAVFSWSAIPAGDPMVTPWLRATFEDTDTDEVTLTMEVTNLAVGEYVDQWYFNIDPVFFDMVGDPLFSVAWSSGVVASSVSYAVEDGYKADGDGKYDIWFNFPNPNAQRFNSTNNKSIYILTGVGLTADDFDFWSAPDGGHGPFPTAAHINGIDGGSAWVTEGEIPEPTSMALLVSGIVALAAKRKRTV